MNILNVTHNFFQKTFQGILLIVLILFATNVQGADNNPSDKDITAAIETELLVQQGSYSYLIDVETNDGITTLTGSVNNILEKNRAAKVAKAVRGVRGVINRITVNAPVIDNFTLEKDIKSALVNDPAADSYEIKVNAMDGNVTLTGTVQSWQEKVLAGKVAKGVRGVKSLNNEINVEVKKRRSSEIERDIEQALKWDIYVNDRLIDVSVRRGNVKLSGTTGSAAEKEFARYDAWVAGVNSVNAENLKVEPWADIDQKRDQKFTIKPDEEIKQAVKSTLMYDPRVLSFNPEVTVRTGTVTLTGNVDNLKAKNAAEQDARNVVGVLRVRNFLKVRPEMPLSDSKVKNNVIWALQINPYVEIYDVNVKVANGVAYLSGEVNSYFEKTQAADAVSRAKGVIAVVNNLNISKTNALVSTYPHSPYYLYPLSTKSDWEIKQDIKSQLWWSPFVNADDVNVAVDNGNVTLTGTVDSWNERTYAEENAFEGGARTVNNDLRIVNNPYY